MTPLLCRLRGHRWTGDYRESDGYPLSVCGRCGLTERWAGGMLMDSSDWRESERLNEGRSANGSLRRITLWLTRWFIDLGSERRSL